MTLYTSYEDILFKYNWTGNGSNSTTQLQYNGISAENSVYNFNYFFAETKTDIENTRYYNTPGNDVDGTVANPIYDPDTGEQINPFKIHEDILGMTAEQKLAFEIVSGQSNSHSNSAYDSYFTEVAKISFNTGTATNSQIVMGNLEYPEGYSDTKAAVTTNIPDSFPSSYDEYLADRHGDIWLNSGFDGNGDGTVDWSDISRGSTALNVILHEVGHALGLKGDGDLFGTPLNNMEYTVMSYAPSASMDLSSAVGDNIYSSTLQLYDILAIQKIYNSRNYETRANGDLRDTSYDVTNAFSSTQINDAFMYTIWDGGGVDTIDASGFDDHVVIDLRQGEFSSIGESVDSNFSGGSRGTGLAVNNVAVAYHACPSSNDLRHIGRI